MRTVKHILIRIFFLCCSLLLLNTSVSLAAEIDSAWFHQLVDKASVSLRNTVLRNEALKAQGREREMSFVVTVTDGEKVGPPYLMDNGIDGNKSALTTFEKERVELEDRLKKIYTAENVEAYVLMLNCFDVKLKRLLADSISVEWLFNKASSDYSDIPDLKALHDRFTQAVLISRQIFKDSAPRILLSTGVYRIARRDNEGRPVSDNYYYFKPTPNPSNKLATEDITPLLYRYLRENNPKDGSALEYANFQVAALEKAIHSSKYKASILSTFDVSDMIAILNNFSSAVDYKGLSLEERVHIISVLLTEHLKGNYGLFQNGEGAVMKIFNTVPPEQTEGFFTALEAPTRIVKDASNHYPLIYRLLDEMDDALLFAGGNNYTNLIVAVKNLLIQSPKFGARAQAISSTPEKLLQHCIRWKGDGAYLPGDRKYTVKLLESGQVQIDTRIVLETHAITAGEDQELAGATWTNYVPGSDQTNIFSPFELIGFTNLSKQSFLNPLSGAKNDSMAFMPAIFLDYAIKKKANMDLQKAGFMLLDLATLATGYGGIIAAASDIRKAIVIFNMGTATLNITANTFEEQLEGTRFHEVVDAANMLMLAVGVAELGRSGPRTMATALKVGMKVSGTVSKEVALRFIAAVMRAEIELKNVRLGTRAADELLALKNELVIEWPETYKTDLAEDLKEFDAKAKPELEAPKVIEEAPKAGEEAPKPKEEAINTGGVEGSIDKVIKKTYPFAEYLDISGDVKQCVYELNGKQIVADHVFVGEGVNKVWVLPDDVKEVVHAEKIAKYVGDDIIMPREKFPAVDGIKASNGQGVSFKKPNGTTMKNVKDQINKAYNRIKSNNGKGDDFIQEGYKLRKWEGVELHIECMNIDATWSEYEQMWDYHCRNPQTGLRNDGLITRIVIYLKDGTIKELDLNKLKK
ncbi:hypothetical protein CLV59_1011055 [Chitinophaga dinghuensis]|uniref:Uncharacterized protein n=1 Tax=Chitinophaga dinghuensis TaxID=1539050 RepID=A0A327WCN8_9BACT|nr:hypothetical protein [Chitinophaga dinghuensis]RAJ88285.1 hypothetical protein CLV59_1011055 [Chitinophaga dinghuensis]